MVARCSGGGIYSLDRIVQPLAQVHDLAMPAPPVSHASRPADNELYDRGGEPVEAATAIRRLADDPAAGRAMPAWPRTNQAPLRWRESPSGLADTAARGPATAPSTRASERLRRWPALWRPRP
jgi:hypothetical protein